MNLKRCLLAIVSGVLFTLPISGCGDSGGSVTENASEDEIADYKRMIAEEEAETEAEEEGSDE